MLPIQEYLQFGILPSDPQRARKLRIKAPQYRMIDEKLYRKSYMSPWLRCVGPIQANGIIHEIHQGSCGMHARPLVYGSKAVVPIEISVETKRIKEFNVRENKKRRIEDLNILEERRKIASIR
ncbi:hypothetical protein Tco_1099481 [Tanacetum coccineum]